MLISDRPGGPSRAIPGIQLNRMPLDFSEMLQEVRPVQSSCLLLLNPFQPRLDGHPWKMLRKFPVKCSNPVSYRAT